MKTLKLLPLFLAACLVAGGASALVQPPQGEVLPDYDVRATTKGLLLGADPALHARANAVHAPETLQRDALAALESRTGVPLNVRWSAGNGMPKLLSASQGFLSGPDPRDPAQIARDFLQANQALFGFDSTAIESLTETRRFATRDGRTTVLTLEQQLGGIPVHQGLVSFALTSDGSIAQVYTGFPLARLGADPSQAMAAEQALLRAAELVDEPLGQPLVRTNPASERIARFESGRFLSEPQAQLVVFPIGRDVARLGWMVFLDTPGYPAYYAVIVDAVDGSLLYRHNMTSYVATFGDVFMENPEAEGFTPTVMHPFPDDEVLVVPQSIAGWVFADQSIGNNADAKEDTAGDNEQTPGLRSRDAFSGAPIYFQDPFTNSYESGNGHLPDQRFTITQAFYFANLFHDWLYDYGFHERGGNFQADNFGRGGFENDYIFVDVQDGRDAGNFNNANMSTPPDGNNPRAQFFLFRPPVFAQRDSALDGDVTVHEFVHGLSNRLIGGGVGCLGGFQGGSMGEGWSDYYPVAYYDDGVVGEYATGNPVAGIRSHSYADYPVCHQFDGAAFCAPTASCAGIVGGCEIHDEGQLWAAALWEMTEAIIDANGGDRALGIDVGLTLVTDGMKLSPCGPTFLDARDGILMADRLNYAGQYECIIWQAFADRSMGYSAVTTGINDTAPAGATDLPPQCLAQGQVTLAVDTFGCEDDVVISVADGNQLTAPNVSITSDAGDSEAAVATFGIGPVFTSAGIPLQVAAPVADDGIIQVTDGGSFTVTYNDPDVGDVTASASVSCLADITAQLRPTEPGCDSDELAGWPTSLPPVLDAGESIDVELMIYNNQDVDIEDAQVSLTGISSPYVVLEDMATKPLAPTTIERTTGPFGGLPSVVSFRLTASNLAPSGVVTVSFDFAGKGYTGSVQPLDLELAVNMDYTAVDEVAGPFSFETDEDGFVTYPWPGSAGIDEWERSMCAASDGSWAWRAGNPDCASPAAEQDAVLETPVLTPYAPPLRASYYPVSVSWQHQLELGGSPAGEEVLGVMVSPDFLSGSANLFGNLLEFFAADNTGGSFEPQVHNFQPNEIFDAGWVLEDGLVYVFDFWTESSTAISTEWVVDEVQVDYRVAELQDQASRACSIGYYGRGLNCSATTSFLYNLERVDEAQFAGSGSFWETVPDWNALDSEFPTPTASSEHLTFVTSGNPDDGAHQGTLGVNRRRANPPGGPMDFGATECQSIPTPQGPAGMVPEGQPITLTWGTLTESGSPNAVIGYNVYRIDAEAWPAASSTIDDYVNNGMLVGNTVGQADINRFVDTAPALQTGNQDEYTYVIQPLLACESPGTGSCSANGSFPLNINNAEGDVLAGKPNVSTDSPVVVVTEALLAVFSGYSAERTPNGVKVTWDVAAEIDTLGYHLWWGGSEEESALVRATSQMIPARGAGSRYVFESTLPEGVTHFQVREVAAVGDPTRTPVFGFDATGSRSGSSRRTRGGVGRSEGESFRSGSSAGGRQRLR